MGERQDSSVGLRVSRKAAREDTRATNRRLVLQLLFGGEAMSRADLARQTGLTPATISALVSELDEEGLVQDVGTRRADAQVGKPPTMLQIRAAARNLVALDLSDPTTIRAAVFDLVGTLVSQIRMPMDGIDSHDALSA